jgi:hypothetical protein
MGQAKLRGTYEERKTRAVAIRQAELAKQRSIRLERQRIEDHEADMREAAMTPEEKAMRAKKLRHGGTGYMALASMMAMAGMRR